MKNILIIVVVLVIGWFTYKFIKESNQRQPDNAATRYADTLAKDEQKAQQAVDDARIELIRRAVSSYNSALGKYPASLDELVQKGYIQSYPQGLKYDPATGQVSQ